MAGGKARSQGEGWGLALVLAARAAVMARPPRLQ